MKKNGFTLIELLAVIIILGVLMIIAIPSVTKYINDSRKSGYVSTAKNIVNGVRNLIYSGDLDLTDHNTTYYVDAGCIKLDNGYKSPYGEFTKAYVVVTPSYDNYEYFWTSVDSTGTGVKNLININKLDIDNIETDIDSSDITTNRGLDGREYVVVVDGTCQKGTREERTGTNINSATGEGLYVCKRATTLHTTTCQIQETGDNKGCGANIGYGNEITYGTIPNGTPQIGNAYDCDVNNDGVFDSTTERFYYVTSDGNNSVLIYYKNMDNSKHAYDSSRENWHGPRDLYQYLPSTSEWSNKGIIPQYDRTIIAVDYSRIRLYNNTRGGTIEEFSYMGKAARLLSMQDLMSGMGLSYISNYDVFNNHLFFLENVSGFETDGSSSSNIGTYWLENPRYNVEDMAWGIYGRPRSLSSASASIDYSLEIRPVITVKTADIE